MRLLRKNNFLPKFKPKIKLVIIRDESKILQIGARLVPYFLQKKIKIKKKKKKKKRGRNL